MVPPSVRRLALVSLHTSPLTQPGAGDSGGMNVYVRELTSSLAQAGVDCTVYVRRWHDDLPGEVVVEPGFRVVHVAAGDPRLPKEELPGVVDAFSDGVADRILDGETPDAILANYWLSGVTGHTLKHRLDLPLLTIFHTLARVKAETGDPEPEERMAAETAVVACSDVLIANAEEEAQQLVRLYGADPSRIEIVPPGVDHAFFAPGSQAGARAALSLGEGPVLLFVGRIQPLKGADLAVRVLAELGRPDARLLVVGGASGIDGDHELAKVQALAADLGLAGQVVFVPPQPHHRLSTFYRAADVVLVPSRSESFGLVALEAAACGVPVVAAAVGGLRTLVHHGRTGFLVERREPADYAAHVEALLASPAAVDRMRAAAVARSREFTWATTAARLRRIVEDQRVRTPVACGA